MVRASHAACRAGREPGRRRLVPLLPRRRKVALGDPSGIADLEHAVAIAVVVDHADYLTVAAHNLAVMLIRSGRPLEAVPYLDLGAPA